MATIQILIVFALLITFVLCSNCGYLALAVSLIPYSFTGVIKSGWRLCPENSTTSENYEELFEQVSDCFDLDSKTNASICQILESQIQTCTQPVQDLLETCLPEENKDLPQVLLNSTKAVLKAFCASSGELLLEAINFCVYDFVLSGTNDTQIDSREECKREYWQPKLDQFHDKIPTTDQICEIGQEIGTCWEEYVDRRCESYKTKELFKTFYSAIFSPCKNN